MATIRREASIDAPPGEVWDAVRDWGALHQRLVPGFATECEVRGDARVVTFFTGTVLTERIISVDDDERRLAWSIVDGPYEHHNASARVYEEADGRSRLLWEADVLPEEVAGPTAEMMGRGTEIMEKTLSRADRVV